MGTIEEGLLTELKWLRRGEGLTVGKLAECNQLLATLGDLPPVEAHDRFILALRSLGNGIKAQALRNAYAVDLPVPGSLTNRRHDAVHVIGRSYDSIKDYEEAALADLVPIILNQNYIKNMGVAFTGSLAIRLSYRDGRLIIRHMMQSDDSKIISDDLRAIPEEMQMGASMYVFQVPQKWNIEQLSWLVAFEGIAPSTVHTRLGTTLEELSYATATSLTRDLRLDTEFVKDRVTRFQSSYTGVKPGMFHMVYWDWHPDPSSTLF